MGIKARRWRGCWIFQARGRPMYVPITIMETTNFTGFQKILFSTVHPSHTQPLQPKTKHRAECGRQSANMAPAFPAPRGQTLSCSYSTQL